MRSTKENQCPHCQAAWSSSLRSTTITEEWVIRIFVCNKCSKYFQDDYLLEYRAGNRED